MAILVIPETRLHAAATLVAGRIKQKLPRRFDTNEPLDRTAYGIECQMGEGQITRALLFPAALLFVNSALFDNVSEYCPVRGRIFPYARGTALSFR
ncbi:MAG: hypothetical protein WAU62_02110 [Dehalococcoidales bacterium]